MTACPPISKAFTVWAFAELAVHYAQPCPDDVMDQLVNVADDRLGVLAAMPANSADDIILKLFPLIIDYFEPKAGDPPMRPAFDEGENASTADRLVQSIVADLSRLSPEISRAMAAPYRLDQH